MEIFTILKVFWNQNAVKHWYFVASYFLQIGLHFEYNLRKYILINVSNLEQNLSIQIVTQEISPAILQHQKIYERIQTAYGASILSSMGLLEKTGKIRISWFS